MTSRPLHRWKSFWLGVLVIAFLNWAWARVFSYTDFVSWTRGPVTIGLMQDPNGVGVYRAELPTSLDQGFRISRERAARNPARGIPRSITWRNDGIPDLIKYRSIHIAHWFLILLFLIPWTTFLVWRIRRMKRLVAGSKENAEN